MDTAFIYQLYFILCLVMFSHFVGDFVFQSNKMAKSKSTDIGFLLLHVTVYTVVITIVPLIFAIVNAASFEMVMYFSVINFALHFLVDLCSSRVTSYFWNKQSLHNFFVVVGFDQFLHLLCLAMTLAWFLDVTI